MTLVDRYFPFDAGPGATATQANWRSMARNYRTSGVVRNFLSNCNATLAGSVVTIQPGAVVIDGFYGESTANKQVTISANGLIVGRMDPAARTVTFAFNANVTTPAQSLTGVFEIALYQMVNGALTDVRKWSDSGGDFSDPALLDRIRDSLSARSASASRTRNGAFNATTPSLFGFDAERWSRNGITWDGVRFRVPYAADYFVSVQVGVTPTPQVSGQVYDIEILRNDQNWPFNPGDLASPGWQYWPSGPVVGAASNNSVPSAGGPTVADWINPNYTDIVTLNANDTLSVRHYVQFVTSLVGITGYGHTWFTIRALI